MADIILAEVGENTWLVEGEQHFHDLLRGILPPSITIEVARCNTPAEMYARWEARSGAAQAGPNAVPWLINPVIVRRIKGSLGEQSVLFAPWSVLLDEAATALLDATAGWLTGHAGARLTLRQFSPAEPPPGLPGLQALRFELAAGALARAGADPAMLASETAVAERPEDADRLFLVTHPPEAG